MAYENIKNQRADGELNLTSEEIKEFVANAITPNKLPIRWPFLLQEISGCIPRPEDIFRLTPDGGSNTGVLHDFVLVNIKNFLINVVSNDRAPLGVIVRKLFKTKTDFFIKSTTLALDTLSLPVLGGVLTKQSHEFTNVYEDKISTIKRTLGVLTLTNDLPRPGRINQVAEVGYLQEGKRGS